MTGVNLTTGRSSCKTIRMTRYDWSHLCSVCCDEAWLLRPAAAAAAHEHMYVFLILQLVAPDGNGKAHQIFIDQEPLL